MLNANFEFYKNKRNIKRIPNINFVFRNLIVKIFYSNKFENMYNCH